MCHNYQKSTRHSTFNIAKKIPRILRISISTSTLRQDKCTPKGVQAQKHKGPAIQHVNERFISDNHCFKKKN